MRDIPKHLMKIVFGLLILMSLRCAYAATILRFASEGPDNDLQAIGGRMLGQILKSKTRGDIEIRVFTSGSLGHAQSAISNTRGGTIDIVITGSSNFTGLIPKFGVYDIPYLFRSDEHAHRVLDGKIGQELLDELDTFGLKGLSYWHLATSWRQLTNSTRAVVSTKDIVGLKIRTNGSPVHNETWRLLGANPVPLPIGELYMALEMRSVDAQEQQLELLEAGRYFEVQKYLTLTNHAYTPAIVAMNKERFMKLSRVDQEAIKAAAKDVEKYLREISVQRKITMIERIKEAGMDVIEKFDVDDFISNTMKVRHQFVEKNGGDELLRRIDALR